MRNFLIASLLLIILIPVTAFGKQLNKEDLIKVGGQIVNGTVSKVGAYNFHIVTEEGTDFNLVTETDITQFSPEDERLMIGDIISVVYIAPQNASLSIDKKIACFIEYISKVERNFLNGDIECVLSIKTKRGLNCVIEETGQLIDIEGSTFGIDPYTPIGTKIKINVRAIPARIGNGYVYTGRPARK